MAEHKSQHFVPRCYFTPFSLGGEGRAVSGYNITNDRAFQNAPVKGQCARDYFYGKDLALERLLQGVEGEYAETLRTVAQNTSTVDRGTIHFLRRFAHLQLLRTDAMVRNINQLQSGLAAEIFDGRKAVPPASWQASHESGLLLAMHVFAKSGYIVDDLKSCLIRNVTSHEFIISDAPVFLTNRFAVQRRRDRHFGIASTGTIYVMPLTPKLAFIAYDGDAYTAPDKRGEFIDIDSDADVYALNQCQYLGALGNLYFNNWDDRDRIRAELLAIDPALRHTSPLTQTFVHDRETPTETRFRRPSDLAEKRSARETVVLSTPVQATPTAWLSKLRFRSPVRGYSNGSSVGIVRKAEWVHRGFDPRRGRVSV